MKALTETQAKRCENAKSPPSHCKCRCGGKHHGAGRGDVAELGADDPHAVPAKEPRFRGAAARAMKKLDAELDRALMVKEAWQRAFPWAE